MKLTAERLIVVLGMSASGTSALTRGLQVLGVNLGDKLMPPAHNNVKGHFEDLGGYTAVFETYSEDADMAPLFKGLPDDRCQCPHWGYVVRGRITFRFPDHDEVFEAGDAFYTPAGHIPVKHEPGSEVVMFSPAEELKKTEAVIMKNMQAMQAG